MLRKARLSPRMILVLVLLIGCAAAVISQRPAVFAPFYASPIGTITGRVTYDNGLPAAGVTVTAFRATGPFLRYHNDNPNTAETDRDGYYVIPLRHWEIITYDGPVIPNAKGYTVFLSNVGSSYINPTPIDVDPATHPGEKVSDADFVLHPGPLVTVHVSDAVTGAPDPGVPIEYNNLLSVDVPEGVTGADGTLQFHVPQTHFFLEAKLPPSLEAAPIPGNGIGTEKEVTASPDSNYVWNVKTYGTAVRTASGQVKTTGSFGENKWYGVVLQPNGRPAEGAAVEIIRPEQQGTALLVTDPQGKFSVPMPLINSGEVASPVYGPVPVIWAHQGTMSAAQVVTPDESWSGMALQLKPGATITGTIRDTHGRPAPYVDVSLAGSLLGQTVLQPCSPTIVTDQKGHFEFQGLPPGNYQIAAHGGGYASITYPAQPQKPGSPAKTIPLAAHHHLDVGNIFDPRADGMLSGTVSDDKGGPAKGLMVYVTGRDTNQTAPTLADGSFRVYDLPDEPLTVTVGEPQLDVTAKLRPGQQTVHLVAPPDVAATNVPPAAQTAAPQAAPQPSSPPLIYPTFASAMLDGLEISVSPALNRGFDAYIVRPETPLSSFFGPVAATSINGLPGLPCIWDGSLEQLDGMRLSVQNDIGTLTDSTGRLIWRGEMQNKPEYTITRDDTDPAHGTVRVQDRQGKTLWFGQVADPYPGYSLANQSIEIYGIDHRIAWERGTGDGYVAERTLGTNWQFPPIVKSQDGTVVLHVIPATAMLRNAAGKLLTSYATQVVSATVTGLTPEPSMKMTNGKISTAAMDWINCQQYMWSPDVLTPLSVQNAPPRAVFSYVNGAGQTIPGTAGTYP